MGCGEPLVPYPARRPASTVLEDSSLWPDSAGALADAAPSGAASAAKA